MACPSPLLPGLPRRYCQIKDKQQQQQQEQQQQQQQNMGVCNRGGTATAALGSSRQKNEDQDSVGACKGRCSFQPNLSALCLFVHQIPGELEVPALVLLVCLHRSPRCAAPAATSARDGSDPAARPAHTDSPLVFAWARGPPLPPPQAA